MADKDDDRDEHDYEMREPDFGRVLDIHSRADQRDGVGRTEHGDPIRWGSGADILIASTNTIVYSEQIVRVDREKAYPCNWQMIGTLMVPNDFAASPISDLNWVAYLELIMGVGQIMITHIVNLRALIELACPAALLPLGEAYYIPQQLGGSQVFPWILPGGIVAKSVQARAFFGVNTEAPMVTPATLRVAAEISPYNSGDKA